MTEKEVVKCDKRIVAFYIRIKNMDYGCNFFFFSQFGEYTQQQ